MVWFVLILTFGVKFMTKMIGDMENTKNDIKKRQNEPEFIRLLKAQRVAYSIAKRYTTVDQIFILLAILMPLFNFLDVSDSFKSSLTVWGLLWLGLSFLFDFMEKKMTEKGAGIQEEFDNNLFNLPQSSSQQTKNYRGEDITKLSAKYEKEDLKDWYNLDEIEFLKPNLAALVCQRYNCSWDTELRKSYNKLAIIFAIVYYAIMIGVVFYMDLSFRDFIMVFFLPSSALLKFAINNYVKQTEKIKKTDKQLTKIEDLLDVFKEHKVVPTTDEIRKIQDAIYNARKKGSQIPNWFYNLTKKTVEYVSKETVDGIVKEMRTVK